MFKKKTVTYPDSWSFIKGQGRDHYWWSNTPTDSSLYAQCRAYDYYQSSHQLGVKTEASITLTKLIPVGCKSIICNGYGTGDQSNNASVSIVRCDGATVYSRSGTSVSVTVDVETNKWNNGFYYVLVYGYGCSYDDGGSECYGYANAQLVM